MKWFIVQGPNCNIGHYIYKGEALGFQINSFGCYYCHLQSFTIISFVSSSGFKFSLDSLGVYIKICLILILVSGLESCIVSGFGIVSEYL